MNRQGISSEKIVVLNIDLEKLTPNGERKKSHGNFFHWQKLMSILCKNIASNISFTITCEIEEAGKFDDVVIFYERDGKTLCRLIQIKHRENTSKVLTFDDLKTNNQFKLQTYLDSYVKIKNNLKFEQKCGCEIEELIVCTNVDFDDVLKKCMEVVPDSTFNEDGLYSVKKSSETEFIAKLLDGNDNTICKEFLCKFRFAVKQLDEDDLKDDIKGEIVEYLEKEHPDDSHSSDRIETIYVILLTKIINLDMNRKVQVITDEGYLNWLQEAFSSSKNQLSVYHKYNVCVLAARPLRFESKSLEELKKSVTQNESSLSLVISYADTIFTVQKLVQIFNEQNRYFRLILDEKVVASTRNIKHDFLSTDPCEYLVVVCKTNQIAKKIFKTIKDIHNKIKESNLNKQIIIISNPEVNIENYSSICNDPTKDHVAWDDLDEQTKSDVLKTQIVFQGQPVPFSAIDISHVRDSIKDQVLFDIVLSGKYEIGKPFHDSKTDDMSYFVPRNVHLYDRISNPFNIFKFGHLFAVENMDESNFEIYMSSLSSEDRSRYFRLNNETAAEEFRMISRNNKNKNVSWVHFDDGTFRWKKSSQSISLIKQYIKTSIFSEIELQTVSNIENKSVLVIGEPGMGKSTLLSRLATRSIEQSPSVWVIKIDLNNHTRYFSELLKNFKTFSDKNDVIEFITGTQDLRGFEKVLFESYFRIENKLIVLLDGFDEIAPHYKKIVVDLVKIIQSSDKIKMWITSRPHEMVFLEEQLDVLPYFLSKFTNEDQQQFFKMFWEKHVDKTDSRMKRLDKFVDLLLNAILKSLCTTDDLLLTNIPLQCKIIADVYTDAFIKFYKNETDDIGILDAVDIFDLYNRFMKIKCEINIEEKRGTDTTRPENMTLVDDKITELTSKYKLLCVDVVFGKEDEITLLTEESKKINERSLSDIEKGTDKSGIVCSVKNNIPVFVHRTFAEYFAAMYLQDFIGNTKNKNEKRIEFAKSKLFEPKYTVVRRFFDRFTGTDDVFKYALNSDKEQLCKILENDPNSVHLTDKFGRNVLHLIAGYNYTKDICKYLIEFGADTTRTDELFDLKPVEYAVALKVWGNVNELIVGNENDGAILGSIENKEELMFVAGAEGYTRLIKYLVETCKMSFDAKNEKGVSTLHFAASRGHVETCRYLIETGANIKNNFVDYGIFQNETPFHVAIRKGFIEIVKLFIENDRNIIEDICYNETLLHKAMESGNVEILRLLVDHGANVNSVNRDGETPLHIPSEATGIDVIDFLLERGANIEALDNRKYNPLMKYVEVGNVSVVRHLLAKRADIYHYSKYNKTVLHYATFYGHLNILEMLITHDPNIVTKIPFSETLLHEAMISNNMEIIELLIENGTNVNGRNDDEETPLHISSRETKTEIIDTLLSHGADIDATDHSGNTPLIKYFKVDNLSVVQLLVKKGANLHHSTKNGLTVLHYAASTGNLNMVEMLIARDATIMDNPNVTETVLHAAMKSSELRIIEVLIRHGANVNGRNENGEVPLHITKNTDVRIINILLKSGTNIDATSADGTTPLMKYAEAGNCKVVKHLVRLGADIRHCSANNRTAFHCAVAYGNLEMIDLLIRHDETIVKTIAFANTLLHEAMKSNDIRNIHLLIGRGADVNGRNEEGETPLHIAHKYTRIHAIKLLLKHGADVEARDNYGKTPIMKFEDCKNIKAVQLLRTFIDNSKKSSKHQTNICK